MDQDEIMHLYKQTFNAWNVLLMVCTWVGLRIAREVLPELFAKQPVEAPLIRKLPRRLMPVYPVWICTFCYVAVPGPWIDPSLNLGQKLMLGLLCGFVAGHSHAMLARMLPEPMRALLIDGVEARKVHAPQPVPVAEEPSQSP